MATARLAGLALGGAFGFFLVFAGLFSDGPTSLMHRERLLSFGLVAVGFFVAGLATSLATPTGSRRWAWAWPSAPPALLTVAYVAREPGLLVLGLVYVAVAAGSAWAGAQVPRGPRRVQAV